MYIQLAESDSEDFCLWMDLWDEEDCPVSNAGSIVDNSLGISNQDNFSSVGVASMGDFDSEDFSMMLLVGMEHLGRRMHVGASECIWGFSAGLSYCHTGGVIKGPCISHGRLWISGVGCLLDWT